MGKKSMLLQIFNNNVVPLHLLIGICGRRKRCVPGIFLHNYVLFIS